MLSITALIVVPALFGGYLIYKEHRGEDISKCFEKIVAFRCWRWKRNGLCILIYDCFIMAAQNLVWIVGTWKSNTIWMLLFCVSVTIQIRKLNPKCSLDYFYSGILCRQRSDPNNPNHLHPQPWRMLTDDIDDGCSLWQSPCRKVKLYLKRRRKSWASWVPNMLGGLRLVASFCRQSWWYVHVAYAILG